MHSTRITTPDGVFTAHFSDQGLAGLDFPSRKERQGPPRRKGTEPLPAGVKAWAELIAQALREVLAGRAPMKFPPLDLSAGTKFQQEVWRVLQRIPAGKTVTYSELARSVGRPRAVRAVGGACGANPIPVLVPCHRVLQVGGKLGGFSGGLDWKRLLLARESIAPDFPSQIGG